MVRLLSVILIFLCFNAMPLAADAAKERLSPAQRVEALRRSPKYQSALAIIKRDHGRLVAENIKLTEIPAPPFKEEAKARVFRDMLRESGLPDAEIDAEGNLIALRKGTGNGPLLAVAAHLDTVFPEGTDVKVKHDGNRLRAPGIADDTRGLVQPAASSHPLAARLRANLPRISCTRINKFLVRLIRGKSYSSSPHTG